MAFVLDTAGIPIQDRVEAVHTAMMYASAPCHVIHENPDGPVYARMEVWDLGDANVFTQRSSGIRLVRTSKLARQDAMPVIALSVQQRGSGRLEQAGRQEVSPTGELIGVDLSGAYDYYWSGHGGAGCLQIPLDRLGLPVDVIRPALGNLRASPMYRLVTTHIAQLAQDPARITTDPVAATVAAASIDLCRALLASASRNDRHSRQALAETLLTRIRAFVRQHLTDPDLNPAMIAAAHNISLRHLYKVCAQADLSLEQWIISERLQGARQELLQHRPRDHSPRCGSAGQNASEQSSAGHSSTTRTAHSHRSIAAIAHAWGFRDPTHFTRRFRARYGVTPSRLSRASTDAP